MLLLFFPHIAAAVSDFNAFAAMSFLFDICKVKWCGLVLYQKCTLK
jgi:hypothetical protein